MNEIIPRKRKTKNPISSIKVGDTVLAFKFLITVLLETKGV